MMLELAKSYSIGKHHDPQTNARAHAFQVPAADGTKRLISACSCASMSGLMSLSQTVLER